MIEYIIGLGLIGCCLVLSGLFSGSEMGFISINRVRLKHLVKLNNQKAVVINYLIDDIHHLLATMLVGINIAIITASCLTTYLFESISVYTEAFLIIILLLFGEIIPKTIFRRHANKLILSMAYPLKWACVILLPLVNLVTKITNPFINIWTEKGIKRPFLTKEEIILLMEQEGNLDKDEEEMIDGIFELSLTKVKEIMTPRVDIVSLSSKATMIEILECFREYKYSRLPVYDETIDNIIGIIYVKDILSVLETPDIEKFAAIEFIRFPYFVPTTKRIDQLLEEFQSQRNQLAIVVDEYGGTSGLVTLEDLLEEIFGEIQDEHEQIKDQIKFLSKGVYLLDAKIGIDKLNEELNWTLPSSDFETISGLILELLGKIPHQGEVIEYENLRFTIIESNERTIEKIKVEEIHPFANSALSSLLK